MTCGFTIVSLLGATLAIGLAGPHPAMAFPTGVCPNVVGAGPFGGGGIGSATDCTIDITIPTTGTTLTIVDVPANSTVGGGSTAYESIEDVLVGVQNTSSSTVSSINLTGSSIFGFYGDGIDSYAGISPNAQDNSFGSYGGPINYFTNIDPTLSNGTVNFIGGLAPGATTYFSLEEPVSGGISGSVPNVPEPMTLTLLGTGLLSLVWVRRRRSR